MSILQAVILGIVQGVAEFLPISSSGHLVLLSHVFGIDEPSFTFDIVVHIGSLVAIVAVFWRDIWALVCKPFQKMTGLLIVGTLPVVVAGLFLRGPIEAMRDAAWVAVALAVAFVITGILLVVADKIKRTHKEERDITYTDALIVGVAQACALPPGISRSGTTIAAGLGRGINRAAAAKYSFMLALIAIAGAGFVEMVVHLRRDAYEIAAQVGGMQMLFGFAASALVGYLSIRLLLGLIRAAKLRYFSYYVWALAVLIMLDFWVVNQFFERG
jgi:undecaprenyl-diphosphatase